MARTIANQKRTPYGESFCGVVMLLLFARSSTAFCAGYSSQCAVGFKAFWPGVSLAATFSTNPSVVVAAMLSNDCTLSF